MPRQRVALCGRPRGVQGFCEIDRDALLLHTALWLSVAPWHLEPRPWLRAIRPHPHLLRTAACPAQPNPRLIFIPQTQLVSDHCTLLLRAHRREIATPRRARCLGLAVTRRAREARFGGNQELGTDCAGQLEIALRVTPCRTIVAEHDTDRVVGAVDARFGVVPGSVVQTRRAIRVAPRASRVPAKHSDPGVAVGAETEAISHCFPLDTRAEAAQCSTPELALVLCVIVRLGASRLEQLPALTVRGKVAIAAGADRAFSNVAGLANTLESSPRRVDALGVGIAVVRSGAAQVHQENLKHLVGDHAVLVTANNHQPAGGLRNPHAVEPFRVGSIGQEARPSVVNDVILAEVVVQHSTLALPAEYE
eukprot:3927379-Rhodomonas_salina.1